MCMYIELIYTSNSKLENTLVLWLVNRLIKQFEETTTTTTNWQEFSTPYIM